ncbi:MAG: patatin-like phospholipase family protein [Eubacteriaceae bacterium]|jgi:predicted patatin/cPLA2 family phospholipase
MLKQEERKCFRQVPDTALVLEGGGLRGIWSAGVLDRFMDLGLTFPYIIGVSMGAITGASYVSRQRGRFIGFVQENLRRPAYMGWGNLLREGNYFGRRFAYEVSPRRFLPFDFKAFYNSPERLISTATDIRTGRAVYFEKNENRLGDIMAATSSIPFVSRPVSIGPGLYLDGGTSDSVPIQRALDDGYNRAVLILTRPRGYRKEPYAHPLLARSCYRKYPKMAEAILNRHKHYNRTMDQIDRLEDSGQIFVFRPDKPIQSAMLNRDLADVEDHYNEGYAFAKAAERAFLNFAGV